MRIIKLGLVSLVMALMSTGVWAAGMERFVEGVHYTKVEGVEKTPGTVVEFFSFGCPHCNHLEPLVDQWLTSKKQSVQFDRVPATWNPSFRQLAQVYYVIAALGLEDKAVPMVFAHIHDDKKPLSSASELAELLAPLEVTAEQVSQAWDSEAVANNMKKAGNTFATYQLRGVPAIVVNGQYKTTVRMAGSGEQLFEVVNFLLSK